MQHPTRVMVVDDDPDFINVLSHNLLSDSDNAYEIDSVSTLKDGMNELRKGHHDIYLLDYELDHGATGDALIAEANDLMRTTVMISGYKDKSLGDRMINAGASDFLAKEHINGALLDRVIRNALGRRQRLQELLEQQKELTRKLSFDPLTGLLGRTRLQEQIEQHLALGNPSAAMLYLDLDAFKPINDMYGHAAGDAVLQQVASRLIECLKPGDIVGRIGGDEFIVYLRFDKTVTQPDRIASIISQRVLSAIANPYTLSDTNERKGTVVTLSASIGISIVPTDGARYADLVSYADRAMYQAKKQGKNDFYFFENLTSEAAE